jgi:hypothetical protein
VYLGEAHVDGAADHDKIKIGRSEGRFRALQIRVDYAAVEFNHVVVHYANGTSEEVQVRQKIRAGGSTRDIDLAGGDRAIVRTRELWIAAPTSAAFRVRDALRLHRWVISLCSVGKTGEVLYRFNTGGRMNGGVVTYSINGKQYVAVVSGAANAFWGWRRFRNGDRVRVAE